MIVVSDTTPLNYLVLIRAIDVLPGLFQEVIVPPSVMAELSRPKTPELVRIWTQQPPSWLKIIGPKARLPATAKLDDGEADAISLAKEIKIQDLLIDERRGRTVAQRLGLIPLPTLTVLERAAELDLLDLAKSLLALQSTNFRLPQAAITDALARDAARKNKPNQPP